MLKGCSNELNETRSKLEHLRSADSELKKVKLHLQEKEEIITKLINDLDKEKFEKMDIMLEKEKLETDYQEEKNIWNLETKKLKDQVNELSDKIISKNTSAEGEILCSIINKKTGLCSSFKWAFWRSVS